MINLLSYERKSEIRAARVNVILSRYIAIVAIAVVFIMGVLYVSYTVLQQTMGTAEDRIASNDVKAGVYSSTKQQVDALSAQLSEARLQLDQEVSYAQILTKIGQAMPADTILDALALNETAISGAAPVELVAFAKTNEDAALIQTGLQSSQVFTSVNITSTETETETDGYPIKVTLSATFNRSAL